MGCECNLHMGRHRDTIPIITVEEAPENDQNIHLMDTYCNYCHYKYRNAKSSCCAISVTAGDPETPSSHEMYAGNITKSGLQVISSVLRQGDRAQMKDIANNLSCDDRFDLFLQGLATEHGIFTPQELTMIAETFTEGAFIGRWMNTCLAFLDSYGFDYNTPGEYEIYCGTTYNLLRYACHNQNNTLILALLDRKVDASSTQIDENRTIGAIECLLMGHSDGYQGEADVHGALDALLAYGVVQHHSAEELED